LTFTPRCTSCGLHGDAGCYLRFAKLSHAPVYRYEKRKVGLGITDWCIEVLPKPRHVADPDKDACPEWRDAAGRSEVEVRRAMADGETG